ncbi:hypothetical protein ACHAXT_012600 [Thalassiosira profunda]
MWRRRRAVLLGAICAGPGLAASRSWTCSLSYSPVQNVELSGPQQELLREKDGGGGRHLRARALANYDAIGLPRGYVERHLRADTIYDGVNSTAGEDPAAVYQEGRICTCATGLASGNREYYCPTPTDHCSVWRPWHSATHRVTCYQETTWTVGFARNVWYYLCFALLVLAIYPCFAGPGRHAIRFIIAKCVPRMNTWITEQLLEAEIEARSMVREEYEYAARLQRQTEGWLSGYSLKTKRYDSRVEDEMARSGHDCQLHHDEDHDECKESEESMCTICLLSVEDGERIADLSCGHLYHADCLAEWILKKNSCPLCQNPEIAKEIRTYETTDDSRADQNREDAGSRSIVSRWGHHFRERCVDIATGRHQWVLAQRHQARRIRMARQVEEIERSE